MELTPEQYQRISKFLDTDMTLEEMTAFDAELDNNPSMREQLTFEQSVRDAFLKNDINETTLIKNSSSIDYNDDHKKELAKINTTIKRMWVGIAVAASLLVAIATIIFFKKSNNPNREIVKNIDTIKQSPKNDTTKPTVIPANNEAKLTYLFKQYFEKDTVPESYPMYLADALTQYEEGNYAPIQALDLNKLPDTRGTETDIKITKALGHYYKGIAYMQSGKASNAIDQLQWVQKNGEDTLLLQKASWYLTLAYLQNHEAEKAIAQLQTLAATNIYKRKAKQLLAQLNSK